MQKQDAKQQFFAKVMHGCRFIRKIWYQMCKRPIEQNIIIRDGTADCHEKWNAKQAQHSITAKRTVTNFYLNIRF